MILVLTPKPPPPAEPKLRNRVGIKGIFDRNLDKRERVTLERAIEILRIHG